MDRTLRLLGGIGLGAGLMYFLDPRQGRHRRGRVRDRLVHLAHKARAAADVTARDAANRAAGVWAEAKAAVTGRTADDRTLAERVRSHLGRCASHPRAVKVVAGNGVVTLSGPILAGEVENLLTRVRAVPGVSRVENQLDVHERADNHPALRGGVPRTGPRGEFFQARWSPPLRLLAGTVGLALMGNCLASGDAGEALLGALGFGLSLRAATNTGLGELVGETLPVLPGTGAPELLAVAAAGPGL
jgi:hypothetical protein